MFGLFRNATHQEVSAAQLDALLRDKRALVVDVREVDEFKAGHIPGAINLPLSRFSPDALPDADGRTLVLNCAGGKRSAMALDRCGAIKARVNTHLAGGFGAWKAAGFLVAR